MGVVTNGEHFEKNTFIFKMFTVCKIMCTTMLNNRLFCLSQNHFYQVNFVSKLFYRKKYQGFKLYLRFSLLINIAKSLEISAGTVCKRLFFYLS